ncbi:MAG: helix-turn-helix domain-containing protein [Lachnospiraceae bacterium]|nr:helix-turn-helix domain-containing protein [Lachnospiraceae bacterium]
MVSPMYKEAGKRIRKLRITKRYTRKRLAQEANISTKFIYEIETGKKGFTAEVLYRLSEALEVRCDYILAGKTDEDAGDIYISKLLSQYDEQQKVHLLRILELINEIPNVSPVE